jgi:hypothetical protein
MEDQQGRRAGSENQQALDREHTKRALSPF